MLPYMETQKLVLALYPRKKYWDAIYLWCKSGLPPSHKLQGDKIRVRENS